MTTDRFRTPLYRTGEAAGYLSVPPSTLTTWAFGYERGKADGGVVRGGPVITAVRPAAPHDPSIPFIGLAEAYGPGTR
jgi:hypothetical protein